MDGDVLLKNSFGRTGPKERLAELGTHLSFSDEELTSLKDSFLLPNAKLEEFSRASIESSVGVFPLPLGVVRNVPMSEQFVHVPLAVEEASVVSGASYAAKILSYSKGITSKSEAALQLAQIALLQVGTEGEQALLRQWGQVQDRLMSLLERMHARGGGLRGSEYRRLPSGIFVFHFTVDVRDAMGANIVNTAAERLAPLLEEITGGSRLGAILSNYSEQRIASAQCILEDRHLPRSSLGSQKIAERISQMGKWAEEDLWRAVTHNKGIMNGVSALALATGNDFRALEAAAHALASSMSPDSQHASRYGPLSTYEYSEGQLSMSIQIPALFATVGGATSHPVAQWSFRVLGINLKKEINAHMLNRIAASLGLVQNFAALLALVTTGIQHGHRKHDGNMSQDPQ